MISDDADRELCAKYPEFFKVGTNGQFGFECGPGWLHIIENLCESLKITTTQMPTEKIRFIQIKEKFGTLRLYHSNTNSVICEIVDHAEQISSRTCEICGVPGRLISNQGWQRTRCPDHEAPTPRMI